MWRTMVSPGSGEARTGSLVMSVLSLSSVFCVSSIQRKESNFFSNLYREPVTPSFKAKTECIPLCVLGSSFTIKETKSEINNISSV
jgi:hypothetical protein